MEPQNQKSLQFYKIETLVSFILYTVFALINLILNELFNLSTDGLKWKSWTSLVLSCTCFVVAQINAFKCSKSLYPDLMINQENWSQIWTIATSMVMASFGEEKGSGPFITKPADCQELKDPPLRESSISTDSVTSVTTMLRNADIFVEGPLEYETSESNAWMWTAYCLSLSVLVGSFGFIFNSNDFDNVVNNVGNNSTEIECVAPNMHLNLSILGDELYIIHSCKNLKISIFGNGQEGDKGCFAFCRHC